MENNADNVSARKADDEPFARVRFTMGELYLFHPTAADCPAEGALWGVFDKRSGDEILLESSSEDLHRFRTWHRLPDGYRFCRRATRAELRDYMFNLSLAESLPFGRFGTCG